MAFILVPVTNVEVAKIITSFLALKTLGNCLNNSFSYYSSSKWPDSNLFEHAFSY